MLFGKSARRDQMDEVDAVDDARPPLIRLMTIPAASAPAVYLGATTFEEIPGYVFLDWDAEGGVLTAAYPTTDWHGFTNPRWVLNFKPQTRCLISVVRQGFHAPDGPDVVDHGVAEGDRRMHWSRYAAAIGQAAPYWPQGLEHRELIEAWKPGHETVTAVPKLEVDFTPLLRMAALYPPGSPAHRVLMHYYLTVLHAQTGGSRSAVEAFDDRVFFPELADNLVLAATSIVCPRPGDADDEDDPLDEQTIRVVLAEIVHRSDTLAEQVVAALHEWGATKYFPFATIDRYRVGACAMLEQWLPQLQEVPTYLPDPRFGYFRVSRERLGRRFVDRETGAPVVEVLDHTDCVCEYLTLLPRRLPATTPLAELIVDCDGRSLWVRTEDGTLYPAPGGEYGVAWAHDGYIAPLVERLLDDINAEPIDKPVAPQDNGLTLLTKRAVPDGTIFTREQLENARRA